MQYHNFITTLLSFLLLITLSHSAYSNCDIIGETEVCLNAERTYEFGGDIGSGQHVEWDISNGATIIGSQTDPTVDIQFANAGMYLLTVELVDGGSVIDSCELMINVNTPVNFDVNVDVPPPPNQENGNSTVVTCLDDVIDANVFTNTGMPYDIEDYSFTWYSNGSGVVFSNPNGEQTTVQFTSAGTFDICVRVEGPDGCVEVNCAMYDFEVIDNTSANIAFEVIAGEDLGDSIEVCGSQEILFKNNSTINTAQGWKWTITDMNSNSWTYTTRHLRFPFPNPGSYEVTLQWDLNLNCVSNSVTKDIAVLNGDPINIICPSVVCEGDIIEYSLPSTVLPCQSYIWEVSDNGLIVENNNESIKVEWGSPGELGYGYVIFRPDGCSGGNCVSPAVQFVPIIPDSVEIEGPDFLCGLMTPYFNVPDWQGADYTWSLTEIIPGNGNISISTNNAPTAFLSVDNGYIGKVEVSVEIEHPLSGCLTTATKIVDVFKSSISGPTLLCADVDTATFTIVDNSSYQFEWKIYQGTDITAGPPVKTDTSDNSWTIDIANDIPAGGVYTVVAGIIGSSISACMLEYEVEFLDPLQPYPEIYGPLNICPGDTVTYYVYPFGGASTNWEVTEEYDNGDPPQTNFYTGTSIQVAWDQNFKKGQIMVQREIDTCSSPYTSIMVTTQDTSYNIMGDQAPCPESEVVYWTDNDGAGSYDWSLDSAHANLGSIIAGQGTDEITIQWHYVDTPTDVTITLNSDVCGQPQSEEFVVTLTPVSFNLNGPSTICQNETANYSIDVSSWKQIEWFVDGQQLQENSNTLNYVFSSPNYHTIRVEITDPDSCAGIYKYTMNTLVNEIPAAHITQSSLLPCPEGSPFSTELKTLYVPGADYQWRGPGGPISGNSHSLTVTETSDGRGEYSVIVTENGCSNRDSFLLDYNCTNEEGEDYNDTLCCPVYTVDIDVDANLNVTTTACGAVHIEGELDPDDEASTLIYPTMDGQGTETENFPSGNPIVKDITINEPGTYPIYLVSQEICSDTMVTDTCPIRASTLITIPFIAGFEYDLFCGDEGEYILILFDDSKIGVDSFDYSAEWITSEGNFPGDSKIITVDAGSQVSVQRKLSWTNGSGYSCLYEEVIDIPDYPTAAFTVNPDRVTCEHSVNTFVPVIDSSQVLNYKWTFEDGTMSVLRSPQKVFNSIGSHDVILDITTINGCEVSDTMQVIVYWDNLDGTITADTSDCNSNVELLFEQSGGDTIKSYNWAPSGADVNPLIVDESGIYSLTVTDGHNCTWESGPYPVDIVDPFIGGLQGDFEICQLTANGEAYTHEITINGNEAFDYEWLITPDFFASKGDDYLRFHSTIPSPGIYTITVIAKDTASGVACDTISKDLTIHPSPDEPLLTLSTIECDPFLGRIDQSPHDTVYWNGPGYSDYESDFINVNQEGSYEAYVKNQFGCRRNSKSVDVQIPDLGDLLTGCYEFCPDSLLGGDIILPATDDFVDSWKWFYLDSAGNEVVLDSSGNPGTPNDLVLDTSLLDKEIMLEITVDSCTIVSDPFCIIEGPCLDCPADTINLSLSNQRCLIGSDFENLVFAFEGQKPESHLPAGFSYCSDNPQINWTGAEVTYEENYVDNGSYYFKGILTITDTSLFKQNKGGVNGTMNICDSEGNICPVQILLDLEGSYDNMCDLPGIMCMNWSVCYLSEDSVSENYTKHKFCLWLPFVAGGSGLECDLDEYTINVYDRSVSATNPVISDTVKSDTLPDVEQWCAGVVIRNDKLADHPGLVIEVIPNCGGDGCEYEYFPQNMSTPHDECVYGENDDNPGSGEPGPDDGAGLLSNSYNGKTQSEKISVVPNPTYPGIVNVLYNESSKPDKISVIDAQGKIVKSIEGKEIGAKSTGINLQDAVAGFYYILLEDEQSNVNMKKLVIIE